MAAAAVLLAGVALALAPHAVEVRERIPVPAAPVAVPVEPEEGGDAA